VRLYGLLLSLRLVMPTKIYTDWHDQYDEDRIKLPIHNQELFITEPTDSKQVFIVNMLDEIVRFSASIIEYFIAISIET
jgi:hypothetical protein